MKTKEQYLVKNPHLLRKIGHKEINHWHSNNLREKTLEDSRVQQPEEEEQDHQDHIRGCQVHRLRIDRHGCNITDKAGLIAGGSLTRQHSTPNLRQSTGPYSSFEGFSVYIFDL